MVTVLQEGPVGDAFMKTLGESTHELDKWFAGKIREIHRLDVTAPPPGPMPKMYLDSGS